MSLFMRQKEDQRVRTIFPKMKGRTVIFLGDSFVLPDGLAESLRHRFLAIGYRFIVIPNLLNDLSPSAIDYLFPGLGDFDPYSLETQIKVRAGLVGKTGFLYKKSRYWYFRFREISSPLYLDDIVDELINQLRTKHSVSFSRPSRKKTFETVDETSGLFLPDICPRSLDLSEIQLSYDRIEPEEPESDAIFGFDGFTESLDPHIKVILSDLRGLLNKYQLTLDELEVIIGYTVKLSRMKITRNGRIIMTDFKNREVKMDQLTKMIYFFFLRHPEGVRYKEVDNFRDELLHIYMGLTNRDDPDKIRKSVIRHIDPYGDGLRVSASRIRTAFTNQFGDKVAKFYCLEGKKGEPYTIAINRDYVIWEYPE